MKHKSHHEEKHKEHHKKEEKHHGKNHEHSNPHHSDGKTAIKAKIAHSPHHKAK